MNRLRQHHRWAPWWFAALFGVIYIPVAYGVVLGIRDPQVAGEGIRMFIPLYAIFTYWFLAIVANIRTAVVNPSGVRVTLFPFPIGNGQALKRADIAVCYARHIIEYDEGAEIENFFTAGVESRKGQQIDVYIPLKTAAEALQAAREIGRVLNANAAGRPIEVRMVSRAFSDPAFKRQAAAWFVLSLLAILLGAVWELESGTL